jgi:hypothetical protein
MRGFINHSLIIFRPHLLPYTVSFRRLNNGLITRGLGSENNRVTLVSLQAFHFMFGSRGGVGFPVQEKRSTLDREYSSRL